MKKLLIASTALTLVAGAASADVTFSGYGTFGLGYDSSASTADDSSASTADNNAKTQIGERLQLNIDISKTIDSGIIFGGRTRVRWNSNETTADFSPAYLYVTSGNLKVEVGNADEAIDSMNTYHDGEIGLQKNGNADPLNYAESGFYKFSSQDYDNAGQMGVLATYSAGDFVGRVSYYSPDQTVKNLSASDAGTAGELAGSVDYKFGDLQVGAGFAHNAGGKLGASLYLATAEYAMGDTNIGAVIARSSSFTDLSGTSTNTPSTATASTSSSGEQTPGDDTTSSTTNVGFNQGEIYANHKFGAVTLAGYINKSNQTDYDKVGVGIGAVYDLGSGTSLKGSYQHLETGKNFADLGVCFTF